MPVNYGGPGVVPSLGALATETYALEPGQTWTIPSGRWGVKTGKYTAIQEWDTISNFWRTIGGGNVEGALNRVVSDGVNWRLANQTGCAVGALLTAGGSGYVSAPIVTPSAGNSLWRAIVGGAVATAVTVTNGGVGYTYPPAVVFSAPPPGGIAASGFCTLTAGVVTGVTVVDQGAGYNAPPTITFVNDPREGVNGIPQGYNASAVCSLTGAGQITGLICIDHGTPVAAVPTLTFTGGGGTGAAATAIMCFSVQAFTVTTGGAGLAGTVARVTAEDAFPTAAPAFLNPTVQANLVKIRAADIKAVITAGAITAPNQVVYDGGIYSSVPTALIISSAGVVTTAPAVALTVGGNPDVSLLFPT